MGALYLHFFPSSSAPSSRALYQTRTYLQLFNYSRSASSLSTWFGKGAVYTPY